MRTAMPKTPINVTRDLHFREDKVGTPLKRVMPSPTGNVESFQEFNKSLLS